MWSKYKYFIIAGLALVSIGLLQMLKSKPINWIGSYSKYDKIPFGCYVLNNELDQLFEKGISDNNEALNKTLYFERDKNLLIINRWFNPTEEETDALLNYIHNGNQAFISSRSISNTLLDSLALNTNITFDIKNQDKTRLLLINDSTTFEGVTPELLSYAYFSEFPNADVLGFGKDSLVNFIALELGQGKLFIHLVPAAFTNVYMLDSNNHRYVSKVLSHLPNAPLIWDEYHKERNEYVRKSMMHPLLNSDGVRQAFHLILISIILYMMFAAKRKQRTIPVLPQKTNSTVEFVETIGQLYFNENNFKDIGVKRVTYFLSDIRDRYNISTEELDDNFTDKLSTITGVPLDIVDQLVVNFRVVTSVKEVSEHRIIEQDQLIKTFYKKERNYGKR